MKKLLRQLRSLANSNKQENFYYQDEEKKFSTKREATRVVARATLLKP
jgi:adenylate cyclase class IV